MNKTDLIKSMASRVGCTEVVARQMVEVLREVMEEGLSDGNDIVLQGFALSVPGNRVFVQAVIPVPERVVRSLPVPASGLRLVRIC